MPELSHQTVKLSRGRHGAPMLGMCVMELASTLAGERFSDHPRSVSPVIAGLLRQYNDGVDDDRRQALIPYAALCVGTRASREVERERARRCREWAIAHGRPLPRWRLALARLRSGPSCGAWAAARVDPHDDGQLAQLRTLVDELIGPVATPVEPLAEPATR
jgi:hypothetical protein